MLKNYHNKKPLKQLFTPEELQDSDCLLYHQMQPGTVKLNELKTKQIIELTNENFKQITANNMPINCHYIPKSGKYLFSYPASLLSVSLLLKENSADSSLECFVNFAETIFLGSDKDS